MSAAPQPATTPWQCPDCAHPRLDETPAGLQCPACHLDFPRWHGVINTLVHPDPEVVRELEGMRRERQELGERFDHLSDFMVARVPHVETHAEREAWNASEPTQYFLSTRLNLEQAMAALDLRGQRRVLEIGAQNPFETLQAFRARGFTECYALNLHFLYDSDAGMGPWPVVLLGDMNRLPFRDGYFDVVLACATTHHSPNLDRTLAEISRVLAPSGVTILINDPTNGPAKHLWEHIGGIWRRWGWDRTLRNDLIHENEYTVLRYRRLFRKHGLRIRRSFFSAYYDRKLRQGNFTGVRWAALAAVVAWCWRIPGAAAILQRLALLPGQIILGLELNVIVEKR